MRSLLMVIAVCFLISCANTVDAYSHDPLQGEYKIIGLLGKRITGNEMIFNFDPIGNRVSGITGCNNFSANYHQEGLQLDFSVPMNTRKYCEGKMEAEKQILSSLENASRVQYNGSEVLILADGEEPLITLTKIK
ncbi:MAG: META domain-containing protein [Salinimicrobium sediminis]|nr:META domain-containing protein [Salinimicrobium sediminis]